MGEKKWKTSLPFFCTHVICYWKATLNDRFLDDTNIWKSYSKDFKCNLDKYI